MNRGYSGCNRPRSLYRIVREPEDRAIERRQVPRRARRHRGHASNRSGLGQRGQRPRGCAPGCDEGARPLPASGRRDHGDVDPTGGAHVPGKARAHRGRDRGTADARGARQARQAEARGAAHAPGPARLGRRGAPVPPPRARLRARGLRRWLRAQHGERGAALPVRRTPAGRRRRRAGDAERPTGDPGRDRRPHRPGALLPSRRRDRSATASAGSHRAAGTPGSTSPSRRGRRFTLAASASSRSPGSTRAATATWSW